MLIYIGSLRHHLELTVSDCADPTPWLKIVFSGGRAHEIKGGGSLRIYMTFRYFLQMTRRWGWLVLLLALLGGVSAYIFSIRSTPSYQASTTLLIGINTGSSQILNNNNENKSK